MAKSCMAAAAAHTQVLHSSSSSQLSLTSCTAQDKKGMHSAKAPPVHHVNDLSLPGNANRYASYRMATEIELLAGSWLLQSPCASCCRGLMQAACAGFVQGKAAAALLPAAECSGGRR